MDLFYLVCVSLVLSVQVEAQFDELSCDNIEPNGNFDVSLNETLIVAAFPDQYTPGQSIQVFVASAPGISVRTLILQATLQGSSVAVGSFDLPSGYESVACRGSPTGTIILTDNSLTPRALPLPHMWTAPSVGIGDVIFRASAISADGLLVQGRTATSMGPVDPSLSIDQCPDPPPQSSSVVAFQTPGCRIGPVLVRDAICSQASGSTFSNGDTVTCTCEDNGQTASCSFQVTIVAVSPCSPNPCLNDGQCFVTGDTFFCACVNGFTGTTCNEDTRPLTTDICPPVINNFGNTYFWTPPNCLRNGVLVGVSSCTPNPGSTFTAFNSPVTCTCNVGGDTATCDFTIDAGPPPAVCNGNPCLTPGAECREAVSSVAGYTCHITTGTPCPTL